MPLASRRRVLTRALPGLAATLALPARAQTDDNPLTLYTSTPAEDSSALTEAFQARTGQRVAVWRASSEQVTQRVVAETQAARQAFDVVETNTPALEQMHAAGAFAPLAALPALAPAAGFTPQRALLAAHGHWIALRLSVLACAWNADKVPAAEAPATWDDFVHPRWAGRLALEIDDHAWFATLHRAWSSTSGAAKADAWFERLAALKPQVRKGHSLIANLVAAGEVHASLTVYGYRAAQMQAAGAPIRHRVLAPAPANVVAQAVAKQTRRTEAAARWLTFMQGDGQALLRARQHVPAADVLGGGGGNACCTAAAPLVLVDPSLAAGEAAKPWRAAWQQFLRRAAGR